MLNQVYLVRHGETAWSKSGQHTSHTDLPLSAEGEDKARWLAARLAGVVFGSVLSSPLRRARRTCELAGLGSAVRDEPELTEWDYGDYEARTTPDIMKERPGWNLFRDGCPNGESPQQVSDRADRVIARVWALDGNVALFTHGHFGRVLGVRWIGLPVRDAEHFQLDVAALAILSSERGAREGSNLALWNEGPPKAA